MEAQENQVALTGIQTEVNIINIYAIKSIC
jgi:hypothetical protein